MVIQLDDTIVAIATSSGLAGVGIVRVSGPLSKSIVVSTISAKTSPENWRPKTMYRAKFLSENGELIDDLLLVWMPQNNSFTGEDVLELHCHGNPYILERVVDRLQQLGARLAERGEFTQRAFLNGKIDLTEAEGMLDLIHASTSKALAIAHAQHAGRLRSIFSEIRDELINILAYLETAIDFPGEPIDTLTHEAYLERLVPARNRLSSLISSGKMGQIIKRGARIVVIGAPNTGKSTLINSFINESRMIVSDLPGTTRDSVEIEFINDGIRCVLIDTAGIRETEDRIEILGIEQTKKQIDNADILLFVHDITEKIESTYLSDSRTIEVFNKADLLAQWPKEDERVFVCAKDGRGIEDLKSVIRKRLNTEQNFFDEGILSSVRHIALANKAEVALLRAEGALKAYAPSEIIAVDIQSAIHQVDLIIGKNAELDLLDEIFSKFCIGK